MAKKKDKKAEPNPRAEIEAAKVEKQNKRADAKAEAHLKAREAALDNMKKHASTKITNALSVLDVLAARGRIKDGGQVAKFKEQMVLQAEQFIESVAVLPEA